MGNDKGNYCKIKVSGSADSHPKSVVHAEETQLTQKRVREPEKEPPYFILIARKHYSDELYYPGIDIGCLFGK